jgi:hypothetical protein
MKLTELEPEWVNYAGTHSHRRFSDTHSHVDYGEGQDWANPPWSSEDIAKAQGIMFLCPTCFKKNNGPVGTESVLCWFKDRGVPDDELPGPGRWQVSGSSFDDLSLSPSVNVDHEHWHGWVQNGEIK